jgi:PEP-CTERM motif
LGILKLYIKENQISGRRSMKRFLSVASLTILVVGALSSSNALAAGAAIYSGDKIALGVNQEGHLNVNEGDVGITVANASALGISYNFGTAAAPEWRDATSPGCLCEGWGVSGSGVSGFAGREFGVSNLTVDSFTATSSTITSSVLLTTGDLAVTQVYAAAAAAPGALFENKVTITNTGDSVITDLRYVRVMDWDVPLTEFSEFVTIKGTGTTADLELSHDDGFETANPLAATSEIMAGTTDVDFTDKGPADHGAYFKFLFGDLAVGATKTFSVFYGAAANETDMLAALGAVGIELFSLGQSNVRGAAFNDGPTFAFGFKGVGGTIIIPPSTVPEPASMLLFGAGITGLAALRRRRS